MRSSLGGPLAIKADRLRRNACLCGWGSREELDKLPIKAPAQEPCGATRLGSASGGTLFRRGSQLPGWSLVIAPPNNNKSFTMQLSASTYQG